MFCIIVGKRKSPIYAMSKKVLKRRILDKRKDLTDDYLDTYIRIYSPLYELVSLVSWNYIVTCTNCGYISEEKLPNKENARKLKDKHVNIIKNCTRGHIKLMKVRA